MKHKLILIFAIVLITSSIIFSFYIINNIHIVDFEIDSLTNIDSKGFDLNGELIINNSAVFSISINNNIYYSIHVNNMSLSDGVVHSSILRHNSITKFKFNKRIYWNGIFETIVDLIKNNQINAIITFRYNLFGVNFEYNKKIDLKKYFLDNSSKKAKKTASDIISNISSLFD